MNAALARFFPALPVRPPLAVPPVATGEFSIRPSPICGLPELLNERGEPCGLFASGHLADETRAALSR